jgi:ATP-dependent protease ClpP protease subunit
MFKPILNVVKNEATSEANIFLYGIVGDYWYSDNPVTARALQRQLTYLSDYKRINVHLNGPGGDVHEGLLIVNTIRADKGERIHLYNDGICASMMAVILACVPKERRHAAKASLTMIHTASTYAWGNAADMRDTADMLDKHDDVLAGVFADGLGITMEQVKAKWFDGKDHWLSAADGADEGLFTVEDYDISEIPDNAIHQPLDKIAAFYIKPIANTSQSKSTNNPDMKISFLTNFKSISDLGKLPTAERTDAHFEAVNAELAAEGITDAVLVSASSLKETVAASEKVPGLETKVTDLGSQVANLTAEKATLAQKVTDLEATIATQAIELGKPAADAKPPVTTVTDSTGTPPVVVDYTTSVDEEYARIWGK